MASGGCVMAVTLLFFTSFTQGNFGIQLDRVDSINATVGQQVNLSCLMEKEQDSSIGQITENIEMSGGKLRGSVLQLLDLKVQDSGDYTCELTTFPLGIMKTDIHLWVTDVQLSARVTWPNGGVREGDNVTILCYSSPPADKYLLWSPKSESLFLESAGGEFRLKKVSKDDGGLYTCRPQWTLGPPFDGGNVTVELHVLPQVVAGSAMLAMLRHSFGTAPSHAATSIF
ncbi:hypothetical protein AAFF_G00371570 [Aldrovandia affinis]|uniref:Ig-like domain-containing protein n=1 Tax=Aldrovandia affinis TaxID=143900 RepID=A0AAD7SHD3_9TELE|nr:hypothetical protein AAFF_G00371570 [Aldrovandia affinis]